MLLFLEEMAISKFLVSKASSPGPLPSGSQLGTVEMRNFMDNKHLNPRCSEHALGCSWAGEGPGCHRGLEEQLETVDLALGLSHSTHTYNR